MKNPPFAYGRPETLDEALGLLASDPDAKVLAGGQSLLPLMALRLGTPALVVDIGRLPDLDRIDVGDDGSVTIGALVRHADVEDSSEVATHAPLVSAAMPYVGHRAIRNQGTTVGSIAHADPAAEMPAVCLATSATMIAVSARGRREIAAADFFLGFMETALDPDEILVEVRFPAWPADAGGSVVEVARRHGDYALAGVATALTVAAGTITEAALAFFSVGPTPVRVSESEAALVGNAPSAELFATAGEIAAATLSPAADIHATSNYRRHLAGVLTRRGLTEAVASLAVPS